MHDITQMGHQLNSKELTERSQNQGGKKMFYLTHKHNLTYTHITPIART